jgi:hypothetical protein
LIARVLHNSILSELWHESATSTGLDYNYKTAGSCGCTSQHKVDLSQGAFASALEMMGVLMCSVIGDLVYYFFLPDKDRRSGEMSFSLKRSH